MITVNNPTLAAPAVSEVLDRISRVANSSFEISSSLVRHGFELLLPRFGPGFDFDEPGCIGNVVETELIREYFGTWALQLDGRCEILGYRSKILDALMIPLGLQREELADFSRPESRDVLIDSCDWARNFRRTALLKSTSIAVGAEVRAQKMREAASFGFSNRRLLHAKRNVNAFFSSALASYGFVRFRELPGPGDVYLSPLSSGPVRLAISVKIDSAPLVRFPITVQLSFLPFWPQLMEDEVFARPLLAGAFWKGLEQLVPNFGRYRACQGSAELDLSLSAYSKFLVLAIPVITESLGHAEHTLVEA